MANRPTSNADGKKEELQMIIAGVYSFNGGKEAVETRFAKELREIKKIIVAVDSAKHKTKVSKEKTMPGKVLYKPGSLNTAFRAEFESRQWHKHKVPCEYPSEYYLPGYKAQASSRGCFSRDRLYQEPSGDRSSIRQVCLHGL